MMRNSGTSNRDGGIISLSKFKSRLITSSCKLLDELRCQLGGGQVCFLFRRAMWGFLVVPSLCSHLILFGGFFFPLVTLQGDSVFPYAPYSSTLITVQGFGQQASVTFTTSIRELKNSSEKNNEAS